MRAADIPIDQEGALGLCRLFLRAAEAAHAPAMLSAKSRKPTLMERLDRWFYEGHQREVERYLAESSDVFELEARIRALERQPYYGFMPG